MSQRIDSIGTTSTTKPTSDRITARQKMLLFAYLLLCTVGATTSTTKAAVINQGAGYEPLQQLVPERLVAQHHQHHHTVTANDLQELPDQQQQQQPAPASSLGSRPMINGNHATYVEPPADFKPIIYETSDFVPLNQLQGAGSGAAVGQLEPGGVGDTDWTGGELKPSIGRWNDWHDMSIEPDLASSDSAPSARAEQPTAYRTRYYTAGTKSAGKATGAGEQQQQQRDERPVSGNLVNAVSGQELQIKGGQRAPLTWSQAQQSQSRQPEATSAKPPLKLISPSSPAATSVQQQQQQQTPKIEHSPQPPLNHASPAAAWANHNQQQNANHNPNQGQLQSQVAQQEQQQVRQEQQRRGSKRRRKSKSNAEVRIQQLVAASQLQQRQQLQLQPQYQFLHQEHQQLALMGDAGRYKQVNGRFGALNQLKEHPHHLQPLQQRVSSHPARALAQPQAASQATLLKRFAANPDQQPPPQVNSSAAARPRANLPAQRRRSRIKTLLPVGLSSWFLGGIRDLDGRHWHLPSELISRLAVNDVDFGPRPAPEVELSLAELSTARPTRAHNQPPAPVNTNNRPEAIPR